MTTTTPLTYLRAVTVAADGTTTDVPVTVPCPCRFNIAGELMADDYRWPPKCNDSCNGSGVVPAPWSLIVPGDPVLTLYCDLQWGMTIRSVTTDTVFAEDLEGLGEETEHYLPDHFEHLTLNLTALEASGQSHRLAVNRWDGA